jgi:cytoskeleton protein RodZ
MERGFQGDATAQTHETGSRIGSELRAARERLGWEIDAVAEALRLKPAFIRAIEQGDIRNLPGTAYAVGFVRTYATALGLDPNEAIRRFRAEREEVNRKTELDFPAPVPTRGVPAGAIVLVGAIIAIGGYAAWYHYSGRGDRATEAVDALPTHLEPLAPPPAPKVASLSSPNTQGAASSAAAGGSAATAPAASASLPSTPAVASAMPNEPDVSPSSAAAAVPPTVAQAPAAPATSSTDTTVASVAPPVVQATDGAAASGGSAPAAAAPAGAVPAGTGVVIQATADAWIEIKDGKGRVLYQTILHPGDSYKVPDQPQLTLTTGNAAGTQVVLAGNVIGPLKGHVLHNIPLDADSLKAASGQAAGAGSPGGASMGSAPAVVTPPAAQ